MKLIPVFIGTTIGACILLVFGCSIGDAALHAGIAFALMAYVVLKA